MEFTSEWKPINAPIHQVFGFVSELNNLGSLMPDQVKNWQASEDSCSFTIEGMTDLHLKVMMRVPNTYIGLVPEGKAPFDFRLDLDLRPAGNACETRVKLEASLNPVLAIVAKRPLQNLVEIMAKKLSATAF
jgi:carbon monoxide dehydrogenase subunit G